MPLNQNKIVKQKIQKPRYPARKHAIPILLGSVENGILTLSVSGLILGLSNTDMENPLFLM